MHTSKTLRHGMPAAPVRHVLLQLKCDFHPLHTLEDGRSHEPKNSKDDGRQRRQFAAQEKATILRRHLTDKVPVSDLCDEYQIQPRLFYVWQKQLLGNLEAALHDSRTRERIAALEAKLARKDAVIAEVSDEYLALKKTSTISAPFSMERAVPGALGTAREAMTS